MTIANSPNLLLAASRNDIELVKKILDDPSVPPKMIGITIAMAARRRYKECLQILINKWPEHISNNALSVAAYKGSVECLQMLLGKKRPNLTEDNFCGSVMACSARSNILELLWEHVDCTTTAPAQLIAYACLYNDTEIFNQVIPFVHPQRVKQWIQNWEEYEGWDLSMLNDYIDTQFFQQEQYATRAVLEINISSTDSNQRIRKI